MCFNIAFEKISYLICNMDKLEKDSKPYSESEFREFFEAAETSSMVSDEAVAYSQSLEKLNATEAGIRYAERTFYAKGREEGRLEGREEGIRIMASLGIPLEMIALKLGMSKSDIEHIIGPNA